jgi:hypothetical protein
MVDTARWLMWKCFYLIFMRYLVIKKFKLNAFKMYVSYIWPITKMDIMRTVYKI